MMDMNVRKVGPLLFWEEKARRDIVNFCKPLMVCGKHFLMQQLTLKLSHRMLWERTALAGSEWVRYIHGQYIHKSLLTGPNRDMFSPFLINKFWWHIDYTVRPGLCTLPKPHLLLSQPKWEYSEGLLIWHIQAFVMSWHPFFQCCTPILIKILETK